MNSSSKLLVALVLVGAGLAALTLLLPESAASGLARFAQPSLLFLSAVLAVANARGYRAGLQWALGLFAGFFFLYGLVNTEPLTDWAFEWLEADYFRWLFVYQVISYSLLLAGCVLVVRAVVLVRSSAYAWTGALMALSLGVAVVWNAVPTYERLQTINMDAANSYLVIRGLDALVAAALAPVVALYIESSRRAGRESASFATAMAGVILGLVAVYVYELARGDSLLEIAAEQAMKGSLLDAIYVFGYSMVSAGLASHLLHHRLSFRDLDAILEARP